MLNTTQLKQILAALKRIIDTEIDSKAFQDLRETLPGLVTDFHNPDNMFLSIIQSCKDKIITEKLKQELCESLVRILSQVSQKSDAYLKTQSSLITRTQDFIDIFRALESPQQLLATYRNYKSKLLFFTEEPRDFNEIITLFSNKANNHRTKHCMRWIHSNFCEARKLSTCLLFLMENPGDSGRIITHMSSALKKEFDELIALSVKLFISIYQELRDTQTSLFKTNQWPESLLLGEIDYLVLMTQIISRAKKTPDSRTSEALNLLKLYHNDRSMNPEDPLLSLLYLSSETIRIGSNRSSFWSTRSTNVTVNIEASSTYHRFLNCLS